VGDERAETYLRQVAEREFRRVIHPPGWADHRMSTSDIAASALWNLRRAGRILIAAGALDEELVAQLASEIDAALTVRARTFLRRPGVLRQLLEPVRSLAPAAQDPAAQPMRVVPLGQVFRLGGERAPADLHFLSPGSPGRPPRNCPPGGPASSRSVPRKPPGRSCSRRWPRSSRTSTGSGSRWPG
jgi:hypothetical protein